MDAQPPTDPQEPRRDRFEDLSDLPVPAPARARSGSPIVTTAAVILLVSGLQWILFVFLFGPTGVRVPLYLVLGVLAIVSSAFVVLRHPVGRVLGLAMAGLGLAVGIASAGSDALNALVTLALNGFVIYALASSGPAFRRG